MCAVRVVFRLVYSLWVSAPAGPLFFFTEYTAGACRRHNSAVSFVKLTGSTSATAQRQTEVPRHIVNLPSSVDGAPAADCWASAGVPPSIGLARHNAVACGGAILGLTRLFPGHPPVSHRPIHSHGILPSQAAGIIWPLPAILAPRPIAGGIPIQAQCPVNLLATARYSLHALVNTYCIYLCCIGLQRTVKQTKKIN
jgi:hypothetical protein